ncbi:MAG: MFS transporter [Actinobacteria bacterium]|nr:MFS transporter [Actinomycetota bacterium]
MTEPKVSNRPMWILGLVIMIDQVDQNIVRGVVTPLKEEFGLGDPAIGVLLSAFVLVNGIVTVPAGYLADRWNRTRTIGHTVVAWSGITALTAAAPNYASLVAIRAALGFGQGITEPSAASLLADYYPAGKRGTAFSIQQVLLFVGFGLGVGLGGIVGAALGWRWAFLLVGTPGVVVAFAVYRMTEPRRGHGDRLHLGIDDTASAGSADTDNQPLFADGFGAFLRELVDGLRADMRTILGITTMRYALVGVSALLFTVTALGAALPQFYERELGVDKGAAEAMVGALVMLGGVPGVLLGGRVADRYATRIRGARMAIPGYCVLGGNALFLLSWLHLPLWPTFAIQVVGFFVVALSVPALRAGLSDAVPANLRGAGFGAFNLASVVFGQAAAPIVVFALSGAFDDNLRTAFLLVSPPVFIGGFVLLKARNHLDADAAKIFEAILRAMQEQEERALAERDPSVEGDAERVGNARPADHEHAALDDDIAGRPHDE